MVSELEEGMEAKGLKEEEAEEELVGMGSVEELVGEIFESEQALRRAALRSKKRLLFRFIVRYDNKTVVAFLQK